MAWLWLMVAIVFEVLGTTSLKLSMGLTKLVPSLLTVVFYLASFSTLAFSLKTIEVGLAYAIWGGLGIALITLIGIFFFGESFTLPKTLCILLIIAGVIGLNLFSPTAHH